MFSYHSHTNQIIFTSPFVPRCFVALFLISSCTTQKDSVQEDILRGTIAYPFVDETQTLGRDGPQEKFIIKSAAGGREYQIEIPGAARDYDVQIPIADLGPETTNQGPSSLSTTPTVTTDHELTSQHPQMGKAKTSETTVLDSAFGVAEKEGPQQNPSFTLGLAKINDAYRRKNFELCLVEINNLIAFFPNAPQLHKMKGTVLNKMRQYKLAELAWIRTLELDPTDRTVRRALGRLQERIVYMGQKPEVLPGQNLSIPKPVGTPPQEKNPLLLTPSSP